VHERIISAVMGIESVSDRMSYIILRGLRWDIIVLNVHAPRENTIYDETNTFYQVLQWHSMNFLNTI
jgi:hypothetical protein